MQIGGLFHWVSGMHTLVALYLWWGVWAHAACDLSVVWSPSPTDPCKPLHLLDNAEQPQQTEYG